MLVSLELDADFSRRSAHPATRPLISATHPTASRFANCSVPGLQQVQHGSFPPSVLLLSVSPTNRSMQLGYGDIQKIDHVAYETYPCGRCINTRRPLAFGHIVAHRAQGGVTGRSEWTKRDDSNRTT